MLTSTRQERRPGGSSRSLKALSPTTPHSSNRYTRPFSGGETAKRHTSRYASPALSPLCCLCPSVSVCPLSLSGCLSRSLSLCLSFSLSLSGDVSLPVSWSFQNASLTSNPHQGPCCREAKGVIHQHHPVPRRQTETVKETAKIVVTQTAAATEACRIERPPYPTLCFWPISGHIRILQLYIYIVYI